MTPYSRSAAAQGAARSWTAGGPTPILESQNSPTRGASASPSSGPDRPEPGADTCRRSRAMARRGKPSASFASEAFEMAQSLGDVRGQSVGLTGLARVALRHGDYAKVTSYSASGLEMARLSGDRAAERSPLHLYAAGP